MELCPIPLELIDEPSNPHRHNIDRDELQELAESIREIGLIEPIVVSQEQSGRYQVVAGHRRLLACRMVQLNPVPCLVRDDNEVVQEAIRFAENSHRADLTPWEEACAVLEAARRWGASYSQLARQFSRSASWIASRLALFDYPSDLQDCVRQGTLPLAHAAALARITDEEHRKYLTSYAQMSGASARVIEAWVAQWEAAQEIGAHMPPQRPAMTAEVQMPTVMIACDTCGTEVEVNATRLLRVCLDCASTLAT
jgi:ParB family chromosome partitioning protein